MTYKARVGIFEAYHRATTGPRISEDEWDNEVIPDVYKRQSYLRPQAVQVEN